MAGNRTNETSDERSGNMIFEPILEEGVFRFDCSAEDRNAAYPSFSFLDQKARETPLMSGHKAPLYTPTFECVMGQQVVNIKLPLGTSFYGTGEVSGQLERTGKRVFTWNTDAYGYGPGTTSLYQSHPWVLTILPSGEALGVLADTSLRCEIDLRIETNIKFIAAGPYPVITFGPFASPTDVLVTLSHAIGTTFMPPKWSLGYHQCRWSYIPDARVCEIARTFREKKIPCDVIWMDIDYMDGFRCFTFNQEHFPDPKSLVHDLHQSGFKAIWMIDPGIKCEKGYFVYDSGCEKDLWIQTADGKPFVGDVWPGPCVFPDFTHSNVRSWWAGLIKDFVSNGVDGIWNDMNEPAVFKTLTKTMPETNIHRGDDEFGSRQNHLYYHNVYGMLMARSTFEGMKLADSNKRPFVLTRAGFIGSQKYAATWTGDNLSTWEHLHMSISMVLNLGLSGQPLSGPDIGGFAGNATPKLFGRWMGIGALFPFSRGHSEADTTNHEPWSFGEEGLSGQPLSGPDIGGFAGNATPKLFGRWMGIGALFPFSRGHSEADTTNHEPWSFGEECEEVCRLALMRRYRLLPHIYTLFYMAHTRGTPVATPTFFADLKDQELRKLENSFMLGSLLVHASTEHDKEVDQVQRKLPNGIWLSFDFEDSHPDLPALYLRGGSIIPVGLPYQHVGEANPTDDLFLLVALDEQGRAEGFHYEDDGDGYDYTNGGYLLTTYIAELLSSVVTLRVANTQGSWIRPKRRLHVKLLLGEGAMLDAWGTDGETIKISMPPENAVSGLISASQKNYQLRMEKAKRIPDVNSLCKERGAELARVPAVLKGGEWELKLVPWIGGRIVYMEHLPSGNQWLHSRVDINGYEEYSSLEYRSAGCTEEYSVIERNVEQAGEVESLALRGDIGGGLVMERCISLPKNDPKVFRIDSSIVSSNVGAGSGGFSRLVCLRIHPMFTLLNPTESYVSFTCVNGLKHEIWPQSGEQQIFEGDLLPNGEWMLVDKCLGLSLVNRFNVDQVKKCMVHWGCGTVNLELWSEERPVSKESPLKVSHEYKVTKTP
ncbi:unnamed protein product [Cuscuta campestris]|uniref:Glycoside hydrolase family 31 N-terminal domain-containing protein n=1 Tax=Cuscuta campestris TaxID=132261 RepID=A0A484KLZ8_9ASTE|nr:unnamed protein product [Cuscuta campestris]